MTREYYPKELIKRTQPMYVEIPSYFVEDSEFYNNLFDLIVSTVIELSNTVKK